MTHDIRKFLFETSFDEKAKPQALGQPEEEEKQADSEKEEDHIEKVPVFSEEDVEKAHHQGYEKGRKEGASEAVSIAERQVAAGLEDVCDKLSEILRRLEKANDMAAESAISVAAAMIRKLFPAYTERFGVEEVEAMIGSAMEKVLEEPRVLIKVTPQIRTDLDEKIKTAAAARGFLGKVTVFPDPAVALGDCNIEWSGGGAERDMAALWRQIDAIIDAGLSKNERFSSQKGAIGLTSRDDAVNSGNLPQADSAKYPPLDKGELASGQKTKSDESHD